MYSIDKSQALMGGLFTFGAGFVLSGFTPFPLAIMAGIAGVISSISADIITKIGKERTLTLRENFILIGVASSAAFFIAGLLALLPLQGIAGMVLGGAAFSMWLIIRKWSLLIE